MAIAAFHWYASGYPDRIVGNDGYLLRAVSLYDLSAGLEYVSKNSGWAPVDHGSDLGQHLTLVAVGLHLRDIRDPSPTESGVHAD